MAKSILKVNTRPRQTYALIAVAITTVLAVLASGLKAADDASFEMLHALSLVAMLASYSVFILSVRTVRRVKPLKMALRKDQLHIWGIHSTQIVTIEPKREPASASEPSSQMLLDGSGPPSVVLQPLEAIPTRYKHSVRVVVVRDALVDHKVLEILSQFPNVSVLDVQGCSVDPKVWYELVYLEQLKIILAFDAVPKSEQRDLNLTLPEIEFVLRPMKVVLATDGPTQGGDSERMAATRT